MDSRLDIPLNQSLGRLDNHLGSDLHKTVVDVASRFVLSDQDVLAQDDSSCVYLLVDHESGRSGPGLPVYHGPVDRSRTPVLGQQGSMEVERAELRHRPHLFRQHSESHHDEHVSLVGFQFGQELRILEFDRLEHRNSTFDSELFHRALTDFLPAPRRLVSHGHDSYDFIFPVKELF